MKLDCALAAGEADQVRKALPHLPAALEPADRLPALRAWLAAHSGDQQGERLALQEAITLNPADARALERLAVLEHEAGRSDEAARLRQAIRAIDRRSQEVRPAPHVGVTGTTRSRAVRACRAAGPPFRRRPLGRARCRKHNPWHASKRRRRCRPAQRRSPLPSRRWQILLLNRAEAQRPMRGSPRKRAQSPILVPKFTDDAQAAGLNFVQENGGKPDRLIPPVTASGGVGLLDFDNDGWLDVYLVQGGPFPPLSSSSSVRDRLFRNRGDGTFEDVSDRSGIGALARVWARGRGG